MSSRTARTIGSVLCDLLWVPPALLILYLITSYSIDFPSIDQWDGEVPFLQKLAAGSATFSDLIAQHLEHRIGTTRLVAAFAAKFAHWDARLERFATWLLACLCAAGVCVLARRSLPGPTRSRCLPVFLSGVLIFSVSQYAIWLNAVAMQWLFAEAFLIAGLIIADSGWKLALRFTTCMALASLATFSTSPGMAAWVVLLPVLLFASPGDKRRRLAGWSTLWLFIAGVNIGRYFWEFQPPSEMPSFVVLQSPLVCLKFFAAFLGSPCAHGTAIDAVTLSVAAGTVILSLFAAGTLYALMHWRDATLIRRLLPWAMLAAYACATGLATTLGRAGLGLQTALESRYIATPALALVALVFGLPVILRHMLAPPQQQRPQHESAQASGAESFPGEQRRRWPWRLTPALAAALAGSLTTALLFTQLCYSVFCLNVSYASYLNFLTTSKAAVLFLPCFREESLLKNFFFSERTLRELPARLAFLESVDCLRPPLVRTTDINALRSANPLEQGPPDRCGALEGADSPGGNLITVQGWAIFPSQGRPADAVLLTWETAGQTATVFAIANMGVLREDVAERLGHSRWRRAGWVKTFDASVLQKGSIIIRAWAFDTQSAKAFELAGSFTLQHK